MSTKKARKSRALESIDSEDLPIPSNRCTMLVQPCLERPLENQVPLPGGYGFLLKGRERGNANDIRLY